ncbi:MAG: IS110 family transposase [Gammaproteobacteria bacterium]
MARTKRAPEEILDEEYEQVFERVCAIDVAKEFGQVCVRTPRADGKRSSKVFAVEATTGEMLKLGESLLEQGIEMVTLESTSDYWRIFYYLLEACGVPVQLVNARDVKNLPGRPKSDKHDCVWLAKLTERGMLRPSFVPPHEVRVLRDYTRTRIDLTRDRTRHWQRLEKLLEDALIKVTTVASKITTLSVRDMINALIRGERNPEKLADLARGIMRHKRRELVRALDGRFDDHHAELARILLGQIDSLTAEIDRLTARIEQLVDKLPAPEQPVDPDSDQPASQAPTGQDTTSTNPVPAQRRPPLQRLADIPGINLDAAEVILAEPGRWDALLRPTPFRTVRAPHQRTRLKQAAGTVRVEVLASRGCGLAARGGRRRVSSGFGCCPGCRVGPGEPGTRRRSPGGRRSATRSPILGGTGVADLRRAGGPRIAGSDRPAW